ncbi:hypothetical protein SLS60_003372 [Paraconiothyrium brasiliense]|uniref:Uncharacterized protein n=1 Tax=Paraconiothyrium brasiliense TaxID=300254 RepID=A0ABR3RVK1_9PLEO
MSYPRLAESDNVDVSIVDSLGFSSPKKLLRRQFEVDVSATSTTSEEVEAHGTSAPAPGLWLQTISISADEIEAPVTSAPPPALFLQTTSTSLDEFETPTPSAPAPDVWLQSTPTAPAPEFLLQSATTSLDEAATFSTVVPGEPAPSDWLQTQSSSLSLEIASTPTISSYLRVDPTGVSSLPDSVSPSGASVKTPSASASPPAAYLQSVTTRNGMEVTQTIRSSVILTTVSTINGKPITQTLPAFTTLITTKGTPYVATFPATATTTGQSTTDIFVDNLLGEKKDTYVNGAGMYFLGAYLPVILATFFALPWTLVGETTKSLEPFYQMAKTGGAPAERSLAANFNDLLAPLWALFRRQWTVVLSTILAWLASIIVPLAPEAIFVYVGNCDGGCNGRIGVFLPAARAIEAVLAAMAVIEIGLILNLLSRNKTCVSADPRCIAGLATLFSDVDVQREFNELYNSTDLERLGKALNGHNYRLKSFLAADERTVTVTIIGAIPGPDYISPIAHEKHQYATVSTMALDQQTGMRYTHKVPAIIFATFIAALLALIVTYRYTGGDTGFEHFMGGQGLGVKFLFTSIAVIIAWFWARLFRGLRYVPLFTQNVY